VSTNYDFGLGAEEGLFKFQVNVFAQIGATLGTGATSRTSSAEKVSEQVAKNVAKNGRVKTNISAPTHGGMPKAIVQGTFFAIGEDCVGLAGFFEFFFRVGIVRIAIGMKLQR